MDSMLRSLGLLAVLVVLTTCGGGDSSPPPNVSIVISPVSASLHPGDMQSFAVTVTGSDNANVTWAVQEGAPGGTVDNFGNYTAPINDGTFHVVVTSQANPVSSSS